MLLDWAMRLHRKPALKPKLVEKNEAYLDQDAEHRLEATILSYLAKNPDAMDTLKGIAEFWVMRNMVQTEVSAMSRVMSRLVKRGVVEKLGSGPHARYRLKTSEKPGRE